MTRPIESLLGPQALADFREVSWGRAHWFRSQAANDGLFSLSEFRNVLSGPSPYLQNGVRITHAKDADDDNRKQLLLAKEPLDALRALAEGQSVAINRLERYLPFDHPLLQIYGDLCKLVGVGTDGLQIAAFYSPAFGRAFGKHFDRNHIFALQIAGTKIWDVDVRPDEARAFAMSARDVLYLPYAMPHAVRSDETASLSLSFIMRPPTWRDLLVEAVLTRLDSSGIGSFQRPAALPFGWLEHLEQAPEPLWSKVNDARRVGISRKECFDAAKQIGLQHLATMPVASNVFSSAFDKKSLSLSSLVTPNWSEPLLVLDNPEQVLMAAPGLPQLSVTASYLPAITFLSNKSQPFRLADFPDDYHDSAKVKIGDRLLNAGYLRMCM